VPTKFNSQKSSGPRVTANILKESRGVFDRIFRIDELRPKETEDDVLLPTVGIRFNDGVVVLTLATVSLEPSRKWKALDEMSQ